MPLPAHSLRRRWLPLAALTLAACAGGRGAAFRHTVAGPAVPWTHTRFDTTAGGFTFAVVSDLNGGERPGVFAQAVRQLRLLRPELVMSVGDLIDGPTTVDSTLQREWNDFDARAREIGAPFFRVGGNHDLTGTALRAVWQQRYGPTWYAFVYKQVLFLVLDTEDLPPERARVLFEARTAAIRASDAGRANTDTMLYYRLPERVTGGIGAEQSAYMVRALQEHADVRWTFLFFHKPVWRNAGDAGFAAIEAALANRPYSVFSGHLHALERTQRRGRDYFTLGTTGGSQDARNPMAFDHLTLVRMTGDGPSVAHLRLDGILGADGKRP
ncbi:MAG: metallophosphoesterase [Gemmatimonadetes bacterium]|nr:metallophosphoesterase [Gemmatimonadota bacterium]